MVATLVTTTAATPTPTLPLRRRYDNEQAKQRAFVDIVSALNTGGFVYQGQRQPVYPFPRLVTTLMALPSPGDAAQGAVAFITDSQVPYSGSVLGTAAVGGGVYFVPVYNGIATDGTKNWLVGG